MTTEDFSFQLDVPVRNEWSNVGLIVTSVQNCFNAMFARVDGSQKVAMVTGELLENAVKYGHWTTPGQQRLWLQVKGRDERAVVTVENPTRVESFRDLERTLAWIKEFPDAASAYRARLLALAQSTDPDVSKLGLVRIAYEGCDLHATYADDIVRIQAGLAL
jgi:hypothetical protein